MLRHRDITGFEPRSANPETEVRQEVNMESMSPVLSFLLEFFACADWMDKYPRAFDKMQDVNKTKNYRCFGFDEHCSVWCTHRIISHWLKAYIKENYPSRKTLSKTCILKQMKAIGFSLTKGRHTKDRREVWGLVAQTVATHAMELYQVQMDPWTVDTDDRGKLVEEHRQWTALEL